MDSEISREDLREEETRQGSADWRGHDIETFHFNFGTEPKTESMTVDK